MLRKKIDIDDYERIINRKKNSSYFWLSLCALCAIFVFLNPMHLENGYLALIWLIMLIILHAHILIQSYRSHVAKRFHEIILKQRYEFQDNLEDSRNILIDGLTEKLEKRILSFYFTPQNKQELEIAIKYYIFNKTQEKIENLNVSKITDFSYLFCNKTQELIDFSRIKNWDVSHGVNFEGMFYGCVYFNEKLEWNLENAENTSYMFYGCSALDQELDFNLSNAKNIKAMFAYCASLETKPNLLVSKEIKFKEAFIENNENLSKPAFMNDYEKFNGLYQGFRKKDYGRCPSCGNELVLRGGKRGDFLGCSSYPDCRYTRTL